MGIGVGRTGGPLEAAARGGSGAGVERIGEGGTGGGVGRCAVPAGEGTLGLAAGAPAGIGTEGGVPGAPRGSGAVGAGLAATGMAPVGGVGAGFAPEVGTVPCCGWRGRGPWMPSGIRVLI